MAARVASPKYPSASIGAPLENGGQSTLDICDRLSLVAEGERKAYRYAAISWRS